MLCGNEENAEVTTEFTLYMDLISFLFRSRVESFWTIENLSELKDITKEFEKKIMKVFKIFQALKMGSKKWHMINHTPDRIREVGEIGYIHSGVFGSAHKIFKRQTKKSLRKSKSALHETFNKIITAANLHSLEGQNLRIESRDPRDLSACRPARNKTPFLAKARISFTLFTIQSFLSWQRSSGAYCSSHPQSSSAEKSLFQGLS